jgi:hypothetical protein
MLIVFVLQPRKLIDQMYLRYTSLEQQLEKKKMRIKSYTDVNGVILEVGNSVV